MSFFGLEHNDLLEKEKQQFLQGCKPKEDLAVYTWGEESYEGLGDALHEGGDDLNDETFGGTGPVGMDSRKIGVLQPLNHCCLYQERTSTLRAARCRVCR